MKQSANRSKRQAGILLLHGALMLTGLMGVMAIATDGGLFFYLKRRVQAAADTGAMAAAQELKRNDCRDASSSTCNTKAEQAAKKATKRNGFEHNQNNTTVTFNKPPASGDFTTNDRVVEVIVCQDHPTFFMPIFGHNSATVCARAAAGLVGEADGCIYALNPSEEKSLHVHSTETTLDADCGVIVNSNDPAGLYVDSGSCLRATGISTTGPSYWDDLCLNPDYSNDSIDPDPYTSMPPVLDPLNYLGAPPVPAGCPPGRTSVQIDEDATIDPGVYCETLELKDGTITLNPGTYYIKGYLDIQGSDTVVQGDGVMIYLTELLGVYEGKGMKVGSGATLDISAPTSGDYAGIAIFVDRNLEYHKADVSFESDVQADIEGIIYAPNQITRFHSGTVGGSFPANGFGIVSDFLEVTSSDTELFVANDFSSFGGSPLKSVVLVE